MPRILLIDDDADLRETLGKMLRAAGHAVEAASDGRAALALLARERFDLIVTDVLMPEADGLEVLKGARKAQPGIPVVAISGGGLLPATLTLSLSEAFGANAVLFKPFRRTELLDKVGRALAS